MDTSTLIVEIVKAVAWPLVAFIVFLNIRKPLLNLLEVVESLKWKNWQIEFKQELDEAAGIPGLEKFKITADIKNRIASEPRAVILEEWLHFRELALGALEKKRVKLSADIRSSPSALVDALEDVGLVTGKKAAGARSLAKMRNAAAHARNLKLDNNSTMEYVRIARGLAGELEKKPKARNR